MGFHGPYSELPSDIELGVEQDPDEVNEGQLMNSSFGSTDDPVATGHNADVTEYETPELDTKEDDWSRRDGSWSVYSYYCKAAGYPICVLFGIFIAMTAFTTNFPGMVFSSQMTSCALKSAQLSGSSGGQMPMRNSRINRLACTWVFTPLSASQQ